MSRANGFRFRCTLCGNCCTGPQGYVWISPRDERDLAGHLALPRAEFRRRYLRWVHGRLCLVDQPNGDCVFLTAGRRCSVQARKPRQCLTYPFWRRITETPRAWEDESQCCPGIGTGPAYAPEEIDVIQDPHTPREILCRMLSKAAGP